MKEKVKNLSIFYDVNCLFRTWRDPGTQVVEGRGVEDGQEREVKEDLLVKAGVLKREAGEIQETWIEAPQGEVTTTRAAAAGPERLKGRTAQGMQGVGSGGEVQISGKDLPVVSQQWLEVAEVVEVVTTRRCGRLHGQANGRLLRGLEFQAGTEAS